MRALVIGEALRVSRHPALVAALGVGAGVLAGFVALWPHGVPLAAESNVYGQTVGLARGLMAVLMPWIVYRTLVPEMSNDVVLLAAMSGVTPSRLLGATACVAVLLGVVLATAMLPLLLLTQQMTGASSVDLGVQAATLYLAGCATAIVPLGYRRIVESRVGGWLLATATSTLLCAVADATVVGVLALVIAGGGALLAWLSGADRRFRYLEEQAA